MQNCCTMPSTSGILEVNMIESINNSRSTFGIHTCALDFVQHNWLHVFVWMLERLYHGLLYVPVLLYLCYYHEHVVIQSIDLCPLYELIWQVTQLKIRIPGSGDCQTLPVVHSYQFFNQWNFKNIVKHVYKEVLGTSKFTSLYRL